MAEQDLEGLASYFRDFADIHVAALSPLYAALAHKVADTPGLLELAAKATAGQPPANLLFASVHYLLMTATTDHPLARYYPTLGRGAPLDDKAPLVFEDFVQTHQAEIIPLLTTKITNTNEVGRCGVLAVGFAMAAEEAGAPINMIEIGPSVGLNLCWDRYGYVFGKMRWNGDASLFIKPEMKGVTPPHITTDMPEIASRVGIELNPVDLGDEETLRWQLALVFPEHVDRAARLEKAFAIASEFQPNIIEGDAVALIGGIIDNLPAGEPICVFHSQATYQISHELRRELSDTLLAAGSRRPIWRVGLEWVGTSDRALKDGASSLGIARYSNGKRSYQHLGFCDPHGRWLDWGPAALQDEDLL